MKQQTVVKTLLGLGLGFAISFQTACADPTEIYLSNAAQSDAANVLFILDNSGSMLANIPSANKTRMKVMQESLQEALSKASDNVNVGLMRFGGNGVNIGANGVSFPISPIDSDAYKIVKAYQSIDNLPDVTSGIPVRQYLASIANNWVEFNGTPLVDSLYEAVLYFRGMTPNAGFLPPDTLRAAHPSTYNGAITSCSTASKIWCLSERGGCDATVPTSVPPCEVLSYENRPLKVCPTTTCTAGAGFAKYRSPITQVCQKNFIVLMTDGQPTQNSVKDKIKNELLGGSNCQASTDFNGEGECGSDLTRSLSTNDQSDSVPGKQTVETFTIGFGTDVNNTVAQNYLRGLASPGGGFFEAKNGEELTKAFQTIIQEAEKQSISVTSPAYTLNSSNNLAHSDEIFIPVFDSSAKPLWSGNLRKFKLQNGQIVGKGISGGTAVALADDGDGSFESNAQDFWSTEPSGNDVKKGGAAGLLDPTKRNLYVDLGGSLVSFTTENAANLPNSLFERVVVALSSINVGLNATIALATGQINTQVALWWYDCDGNYHTELPIGGLGALTGLLQCHITVDDALKLKYIQFARGYDRNVNGDITAGYRKHMGDILHSKPVVYEYLNEQGRIKGRTVFVGTNEGYLHAIDADTGLEKWAFMPQSLLKNIGIFFDNTETLKHVYGVDGQIRIWVNDADKNGQIVYNSETGEGVYLIFSLGRGGAYYYALNITDPDKPYLQWSIYPNKGDKFTELGESWSKPALAYMRVKKSTDDTATIKPVFVFGAGYDPVKDEADASKRLADQKGRDVYIIDALTGDLIWSLRGSSSNSPLTHSVPSDIRVLDMNHDGALDRLYFADTGGYVWRVDIDKVSSDSNYIDPLITQFADLGGDNNTGGRRMFFSEPDVALQLNQGTPVLTIALGSGYRMHPLSTSISDRFYVLKDENVYSLPTEDTAILKEEVNVKPLSSLANKSLLDSSFKGWYMPLRFNGEKSLSRALTFMGKIIFTTFALTDENGQASTNDGCTKTVTTSRVYMLDLMSGEPLADLNRDGKGKDEFIVITNGDILETPQIVFQTPKSVDGRDCSLGNCEQAVEIRVGKLKLPLLDKSNTGNTNLLDSVDLSRVVPRVYWLNMNVSPQHP